MTITAGSQNNLINVATYAEKSTPYLANSNPWIGVANHTYDDISGIPGQLGATALIKTPIQTQVNNSLYFNTQGWNQQYQSISLDKQFSNSMSVSTTQYMFNVEQFLSDTARPMIASIGDEIGKQVAAMAVQKTYRFYGSTTQAFSSQNDLGLAMSQFKNYGCPTMDMTGVLYDNTIAQVIAGQSSLFTPSVNDKYTNSWDIANIGGCRWVSTNIMHNHIAGSEGQAGSTLTVVSVTRDSNNQISAITFSGTSAATDADSIKAGDKLYVIPTTGYDTPYYNTYNNEIPSANPLQLSALTDAAASGSQVTVTLNFPVSASSGTYPANITTDVVPGMRFKVLNSFKAGLLFSGKGLYVAAPPMPDMDPWTTKAATDPESGLSLTFQAGWQLGSPNYIFGYMAVAGWTLIPQQAMLLIQPTSSY